MRKVILILMAVMAIVFGMEARQPQCGYRGFVDWSNSLHTYPDYYGLGSKDTWYYTGVSTTHGYQINRMFYAGLGVGAEKHTGYNNWIVPVYADGRIDLKFGKFTPFGEIRLGASLSDGAGVYFSPIIGYRFNWGRKVGINVGVGMSLVGSHVDVYNITSIEDGYWSFDYVGREARHTVYFYFRLGFDF